MLSFSYLDCYKFNYESCVGKREKKEKLKLKVQSFSVSFTRLNQFDWSHSVRPYEVLSSSSPSTMSSY